MTKRSRERRSVGRVGSVALFALPLLLWAASAVGCTSSDPPPRSDGLADTQRDGIAARDLTVDVPPGTDLSVLQGLVRRACNKVVASCEQHKNAGGRAWSASITPWSLASCEKVQLCMLGAVGQNCIDRLLTYYACLDTTQPFDCAACLNAYQFVQGACPCLKSCDPACP